MAKYNVSKGEAARLGIERVKVGGGSSSSSSSGSSKSGKFDYSPDTSKLRDLQEGYLSSLKPTGEETATRGQYENVLQSRDLGIAQSRNRAIESPLIRGESAAKMRSAQIQTQPLIARLQQLQEARNQQGQAYGAMMGFEQQNQQMQFQAAQERARQQQIEWQNNMAKQQWDAQQAKARGVGSSGYGAGGTGVGNLGDWTNTYGGGGQAAVDPMLAFIQQQNAGIQSRLNTPTTTNEYYAYN